MYGEDQLLVIIKTVGPLGLTLGSAQSRKKQRRKDRDDGDYHQQFDQRERTPLSRLNRKKREQVFMGCTVERKGERYAYPRGIATRLDGKIRPSAWPSF